MRKGGADMTGKEKRKLANRSVVTLIALFFAFLTLLPI